MLRRTTVVLLTSMFFSVSNSYGTRADTLKAYVDVMERSKNSCYVLLYISENNRDYEIIMTLYTYSELYTPYMKVQRTIIMLRKENTFSDRTMPKNENDLMISFGKDMKLRFVYVKTIKKHDSILKQDTISRFYHDDLGHNLQILSTMSPDEITLSYGNQEVTVDMTEIFNEKNRTRFNSCVFLRD